MSQRDEIAEIVAEAILAYEAADALLAAGLLVPPCPECGGTGTVPNTGRGSDGFDVCPSCTPRVPPGMTAEKLREIADNYEHLAREHPKAHPDGCWDYQVFDRDSLRAWADFLDTQETP